MKDSVFIYFLVKSQVIFFDTERLLELYPSKEDMKMFISVFNDITSKEDFLYFDSKVTENLKNFLCEVRWNFKGDSETVQLINTVLGRIMEVNKADDMEYSARSLAYLESETAARRLKSTTKDELVLLTKMDFVVYDSIVDKNPDQIQYDIYTALSTINYMCTCFGEVFRDDDVFDNTELMLSYTEELYNGMKKQRDFNIFKEAKIMSFIKKYMKKTMNYFYETINLINEQEDGKNYQKVIK